MRYTTFALLLSKKYDYPAEENTTKILMVSIKTPLENIRFV